MNATLNKMNDALIELTSFGVLRLFPKHSIRFAKDRFEGKKITAVEIGTCKGVNAKWMLKTLNIEELHLIDPWEEYEEYQSGYNQSKNYSKTKNKLRKWNKVVAYHRKYSSDAVSEIPSSDFIYIDGNHSYKYVLEDCKNYWKKVKKEGILAGHDIAYKEVLFAVQDFCKKEGVRFQVAGQDWWIVKK